MKKTARRPKRRKPAQLKFVLPRWKMLSPAVWKTDLGDDLPEVVILMLSDEEFKKFHASTKAAKRYIDKRGFLKRKLIKVVFVNRVPNGNGGDWIVIIGHTVWSTAGVLAYQT
ncbi:MAG: hypothetical protein ACRD4V_02650 [Candidatus Acidiferrales bacterium]